MENQQNQSQQKTTPAPQIKLPQNDYTKMDEKTIATIKASAIWNTVGALIMSAASMVASYYFLKNIYGNLLGQYSQYFGEAYKPQIIDIGALISDAIYGAIGGAIAGWAIAKFYPIFVGWQKKFTGNKLDSFFKILFWPYIVGIVISLVVTGALSMMSSAFTVFIIVVIADLVSVYLYARMMDKAVGKYYK
jgi:hypothetical protein